jgi:hypothetical protein
LAAAVTAVLLTTKLLEDVCAVAAMLAGSPVIEEAVVNGPLPNSFGCPTGLASADPCKLVWTMWEKEPVP